MRTNERVCPYQDASLPVEARVRDLLGRMTLEEKVRQMSMTDAGQFLNGERPSTKAIREYFGDRGIGCLQDPRAEAATNARAINAIQKYLVERTRLGIPALVISECLHGHMSGGTTIFPQAIGLASTWNPDLLQRMGSTIAREARAVGVAQALAPDLDLARDPRPALGSRRRDLWRGSVSRLPHGRGLHPRHAGRGAGSHPRERGMHGEALRGPWLA